MVEQAIIEQMAKQAIAEDVGDGDISAALLDASQSVRAHIITREAGVMCGQAWVDAVYAQLDDSVRLDWQVADGASLEPQQLLCELVGPVPSLLTGERCALNFLQTLASVATLTREYVQRIAHTQTQLLDTRKTIPLWRHAQKYAVSCGGGVNHRMGLYDAFLLKENHIMACGSIAEVVKRARAQYPQQKIQIEVETLAELEQALAAQVDSVLLDNFELPVLREAVSLTAGRAKLEASGGIDLTTIVAIAETGVDYISVGQLTKNIQALDLSMRLQRD